MATETYIFVSLNTDGVAVGDFFCNQRFGVSSIRIELNDVIPD